MVRSKKTKEKIYFFILIKNFISLGDFLKIQSVLIHILQRRIVIPTPQTVKAEIKN